MKIKCSYYPHFDKLLDLFFEIYYYISTIRFRENSNEQYQ